MVELWHLCEDLFSGLVFTREEDTCYAAEAASGALLASDARVHHVALVLAASNNRRLEGGSVGAS